MIVYLDQNHIIDLSKDKIRSDKLYKVMEKKEAKLGISFSHVVETTNDKEHKWRPIIKVINKLGYVQMKFLDRILSQEVKNEFYGFIKIRDKIEKIDLIGTIFSTKVKIYSKKRGQSELNK